MMSDLALPFTIKAKVPLSALCEYGTDEIAGHRVKILYASVPRRRRQICSRCKRVIVHDREVGTYVTPYTIQEMPY